MKENENDVILLSKKNPRGNKFFLTGIFILIPRKFESILSLSHFFCSKFELKEKKSRKCPRSPISWKTPAIRYGVFPRNWAARAFSRFFFFRFEFGAKNMTKNSKLQSKLTKCTTFYWCSIICMFKSTVFYELKFDDLIFKIRIMNDCIWLIFRILNFLKKIKKTF